LGDENILGLVYGRTRTLSFSFNVYDIKKIMQGQFILVESKKDNKLFLAQINEIESVGQSAIARCEVLGEIRNRVLVPPIRPIPAGSKVKMPSKDLLESILIKTMPEKKLLLGKLLFHPEFVPVYYNPDDLARHLFISATTGSGKSYTIGVIIEELFMLMERFEKEYSIVIFDVHNEYGGILLPNDDEKQVSKLKQFNLSPRGFKDNVLLFDWEYNPPKLSEIFTPDRLLFIYGMKEQRHALMLQRLIKEKGKASLDELRELVEISDIHHSTKQALLTRINDLKESGLFSERFITPEDFVKPGYLTIFRLAGTPLGDFGIRFFVADILRQLYDKYRERKITHKTIIVIDEAHIFAPKTGKKDPVREMIERISREGRKYGLWLILASQSPRDLSDVVLMQCNSVLALKMHREDISEFSRIFGIPRGIAETLTTLTPGRGYMKAPSLRLPVLVEIRPKCSFDIKGSPDRQELVEKEVKRIARMTRERILLEKEKPRIEKEKIKDKLVPEEKKEIQELRKQSVEPMVQEMPIIKAEEKKKVMKQTTKIEKRKISKVKPISLKYDEEVIGSIINEIKDLGVAARALVRELIKAHEIPLHEALTITDERIIDILKVVGFVEERRGNLILKLGEVLEKRIGRKLDALEKKELLNYVYKKI